MAISDDNLRTSVWNDVKSALVAASIVASSGSSTSSAEVLGEYNDKHTNHPQIIIYPIVVGERDYKFQGQYGKRMINVIIECVHPNGRAVDYMADAVHSLMTSTGIDGLSLMSIEDSPDIGFPGERKVMSRVQTFVFQRE